MQGQPGKGDEQEEQVSIPGKRQDKMDRHKRWEQQLSRQREQGDKSEQMQIPARDSTRTDRTSGPGSGGTRT